MCQLHSLPISEPLSHVASLFGGLMVYGMLRLLTVSPDMALGLGSVVAVIANFLVGCKINLILLDVLGALVGRPVSAFVAIKILAWVINMT